jgi:pimeloyl-ACP methyl ester carboxylesterase
VSHNHRGLHVVADSTVPGLSVAERRVSAPEASLVIVHGGLDRAGSFARLARRLDPFDVIAYDRRGYQGSRSLAPLGLARHVGDLVALIHREAEHQPVIVFGHSFGGVVALRAAFEHPGLMSLVTVYESPLPWVLERPHPSPIAGDDPDAEAEAFFKRIVSPEAWQRLSAAEQASRRHDGVALLDDLAALRAGTLFDLAAIETPAYYLYGVNERTPYYRALVDEISRRNVSIGSVELAGAGHGAHLTSPDQLADTLINLWSRACASR